MEVEKIAANRYRLRFRGQRELTVDAQGLLDLLTWLRSHEQRLTDERADAMVHEALDQEREVQSPEMRYCQYCGQFHPIAAGEWYCPLDPKRIE